MRSTAFALIVAAMWSSEAAAQSGAGNAVAHREPSAVVTTLPSAPPIDELSLVQTILRRDADRSRVRRTIASSVALVAGATLTGLGAYTIDSADGLLAEIDRGFGFVLVGTGALFGVVGVVGLIATTPEERLRDELADEAAEAPAGASARVRQVFADRAQQQSQNRAMLRGLGWFAVLAGVGGLAALTIEPDLGGDHPKLLGIAAGSFAVCGGASILAGSSPGRWERSHAELTAARVNGGVVPVPGGGLLVVGGAF